MNPQPPQPVRADQPCPHCCYDRKGLPPQFPCPECGEKIGAKEPNHVLGLGVAIGAMLLGIALWSLGGCALMLSPVAMAIALLYSSGLLRSVYRDKALAAMVPACWIVLLGSLLGLAFTITTLVRMF